MTGSRATLVLGAADVGAVLGVEACLAAVEQAFRLHAEGRALAPAVLSVAADHGGFHVKAAGLRLARTYFAAKTNANFPDNPARHGRPTIQGVLVLCDAEHGAPLAVMDSMRITALRTAAATALAARHLARDDARVVALIGCGAQARPHLRALAGVRPLTQAWAVDRDGAVAERFAADMKDELGLDVRPTTDVTTAARQSDLCVTCTPSRQPILGPADVRPGTFIAAVGADHHDKQELEPALMKRATVVVDLLEQCAAIGDLHHALTAGVLTRDEVHAELGEVVTGRRPGRRTRDEITVFDSTGTALQDVAAAAAAYEAAVRTGRGLSVELGD